MSSDITDLINFQLDINPIEEFRLSSRTQDYEQRIVIEKIGLYNGLWNRCAVTVFQSYISSNWHQGGSDYISILGILDGRFNYDNKKICNGIILLSGVLVNSVEAIHSDSKCQRWYCQSNRKWVLKRVVIGIIVLRLTFRPILIATKGQFYPKVKFLTPIRFNAGIGLDYKYKRFSR